MAGFASARLVDDLLPSDASDLLQKACEKYPEVKKMIEEKVASTSDETMFKSHADLRSRFHSGTTKTYQWRIQQIKNLYKMVKDNREKFYDAMMKDLGGDKFRAYFLELNGCEHECQNAIDSLSTWMAGDAKATNIVNLPSESKVIYDPLGAVLIFGCWNYPFKLSLDPLIGAIAAGNTCMLKMPSDMVPNCSKVLVDLCAKYLDTKSIKVVAGGIRENQALLKCKWDKIFYTGSARVGTFVHQAAAKHLTPVTLEMGGKNPVIVTKSVNLTVACKRIAFFKWLNSGQTCVAPDYILVESSIAEDFCKTLAKTIKQFYSSDPKSSPDIGRIVNGRNFSRIKGLVAEHKDKIICGGDMDEKEKYISPTLLFFGKEWETFNKSKIMKDEIFGPPLPIVEYKNFDKVIQYVNSHDKPLSLYLFSNDSNERKRILRETSSGGLVVNDVGMHLANKNLPFGGVGKSGLGGGYHGKYSFHCFSHAKAVLIRPDAGILDVWARYPPYDSAKISFLNVVQGVIPASSICVMKLLLLVLTLYGIYSRKRLLAGLLHWLIRMTFGH
mmetsp:Transcript_6586/g.10116  ORF Transcript_6586/g.10116 Transcript_6586/m.10116 type:complete len:556 (+) Transcript_6586:45-1712(+)